MIRKIKKNKLIYCITYLMLAVAFVFLCLFIRSRVWCLLDADMASDMVLARRLNDEHRLLARTFYYSTELRILYYTLLYKLLLRFSSSWHFVRVYSGLIMYIILLVSLFVLMYRMNISKYFGVCGTILLFPVSWTYFKYTLLGYCYIPYIVISFVGFAFIFHFLSDDLRRFTRPVLIALSAILSMLACMVGLRQIVVFYLPLLFGALLIYVLEVVVDKQAWRTAESQGFLLMAVVNLVGAVMGYLINVTILADRYHFMDWTYLSFTDFDLERMLDTLFGMAVVLGYKTEHFSIHSVLSNAVALLLMILTIAAIVHAFRNRYRVSHTYLYLSAYMLCAMIVLGLVYSLSDMYYWDLYSIPIVVFFFPLLLVAAHEVIADENIRYAVAGILLVLIGFVSALNYRDYIHRDDTSEFREIAAYLEDKDYTQGYASFWNGNVLTELSDGLIEVWVWNDGASDINEMYEWLQVVEHTTDVPEGRVFALYNDDEIYFCSWKDALYESDLVYKTQRFSVYGYDSYDEMIETYFCAISTEAE